MAYTDYALHDIFGQIMFCDVNCHVVIPLKLKDNANHPQGNDIEINTVEAVVYSPQFPSIICNCSILELAISLGLSQVIKSINGLFLWKFGL